MSVYSELERTFRAVVNSGDHVFELTRLNWPRWKRSERGQQARSVQKAIEDTGLRTAWSCVERDSGNGCEARVFVLSLRDGKEVAQAELAERLKSERDAQQTTIDALPDPDNEASVARIVALVLEALQERAQ